jgi:hypothetical protein
MPLMVKIIGSSLYFWLHLLPAGLMFGQITGLKSQILEPVF